MPLGSGDLVADHRREPLPQSKTPPGLGIIREDIVIRCNRQFNSFARERQHSLIKRRIAVTTQSEGMNVRITTDQTVSLPLMPNRKIHFGSLFRSDGDFLSRYPPLKTARRKYGVLSRRQ